MNKTKIDWATHTLNPVVGCTYGCPFCYARKMNARFGWIPKWEEPQFFPERLKMLESKTPKIIFMDSMSDIADWHPEWIEQTFKAMQDNPQHKYLFLTKRPKVYNDILKSYTPLNNWWIGISITQSMAVNFNKGDRKFNTFLSIEPLLKHSKNLFLYDVDWVIVGAETGNQKDKVIPKKEWVDDIVGECEYAGVPVFMKDSLIPIMGEENMKREYPESMKMNGGSI